MTTEDPGSDTALACIERGLGVIMRPYHEGPRAEDVAIVARDAVRRVIESHGVPLEGWGYDVGVTDDGDVYRVSVKLYPPPGWINIHITTPPAVVEESVQ